MWKASHSVDTQNLKGTPHKEMSIFLIIPLNSKKLYTHEDIFHLSFDEHILTHAHIRVTQYLLTNEQINDTFYISVVLNHSCTLLSLGRL